PRSPLALTDIITLLLLPYPFSLSCALPHPLSPFAKPNLPLSAARTTPPLLPRSRRTATALNAAIAAGVETTPRRAPSTLRHARLAPDRRSDQNFDACRSRRALYRYDQSTP
ncbi:hypothetical protein C8R47DRAFT_1327773, partial [Mycena vitilis]